MDTSTTYDPAYISTYNPTGIKAKDLYSPRLNSQSQPPTPHLHSRTQTYPSQQYFAAPTCNSKLINGPLTNSRPHIFIITPYAERPKGAMASIYRPKGVNRRGSNESLTCTDEIRDEPAILWIHQRQVRLIREGGSP